MDQAALVGFEIEQGQRVIDRLDHERLEPKVALWMVTPEYDDGRLVLASPKFDHGTSLKAYEAVFEALQDDAFSRVPPILVLRMKDNFIRSLRNLFANAADVNGMRLGGQTIGNRFVADAFVYRIR